MPRTSIPAAMAALFCFVLGACDRPLEPSASVDLSNGAGDLSLVDGGGPEDLARYAGDGAVTRCGTGTCTPAQVCVEPACCPTCTMPYADGTCAQGSKLGRCPVGGGELCIKPCTPPPPFCAPVPASCSSARACDCLDARMNCGAYGGMCASNLDGNGFNLYCLGCY